MSLAASLAESSYDCIIVGSGIAGLYSAVELLKAAPRLRLAVFEKYGELGGRTHTFHGKGAGGKKLQWEAGAGRISDRHGLLLGLLRRYRLHWQPIGAEVGFKADAAAPLEPAHFEEGTPIMLDTIAGLPAAELAKNTIRQLLTKIHGPTRTDNYLLRFPYRAEVDTMRADLSLQTFRGGEMGSHEGFGICAEGFSAVVDGLRKEIERRGGAIFPDHELVDVEEGLARFKVGSTADGVARDSRDVRAAQIVLALPATAFSRLDAFRDWKTLRHLKMYPLLRVYGVFPKGADGKMWNEEFGGRVVSPEPFRYLIGGNPAIGSVQISYTDSQDTEKWLDVLAAKGVDALGEEILADLRRVLKPSIPPPEVVKAHAWADGCTAWLPGDYDPVEESRAAVRPFPHKMPGIWVCGESFSMRQGWVEGALEHAELMLRRLRPVVERLGRSKGKNHSP